MYRGGNWNNGANAGVFALNGNNSRANSNTNIGFRSALALFAYVLRATARRERQGKRDAFPGRQGQRKKLVQPAGGLKPEAAGKPRRLAAPALCG